MKKANLYKYTLIFFFISFLGWVWETIYLSLKYEHFVDRGFLNIPICPIYGFSIILVYLLIGTPRKGRGILKWCHNKYLLLFLYFIMAMAIPTVIELITGILFDEVFNIRLWSYSGNLLNYKGYICPSVSLAWGLLITIMMKYLYPHIDNLFEAIPLTIAKILSIILLIITISDFGFMIYSEIIRISSKNRLKV